MASHDKGGYFAKRVEHAGWYDEMASYVRAACKLPDELAVEQNLLSVAYMNAVGGSRAAGRIITSVENKENSEGNVGPDKLMKCVALGRRRALKYMHK